MSTARATTAGCALAILAACGGADTPKDVGATSAPAGVTPGAACVERANGVREKRADEPDSVHVQHVLVKHADAKNPREGVTRTREEACLRAEEALAAMKGGATFEDVVKTFSDEAGAATRSGELGVVKRSDVQPAFADAAFLLSLNQLSDVVETEFGFHLILRVP